MMEFVVKFAPATDSVNAGAPKDAEVGLMDVRVGPDTV